MSTFSFSKRYNKERLFNIDTTGYEYKSLEEIYNNEQEVFAVNGIYINEKSLYDPAPVIASNGYYVNLPSHMLAECREILNDGQAIIAINRGTVGFSIYKYHNNRFNRDCYSIKWVDVNPDDFNKEDEVNPEIEG